MLPRIPKDTRRLNAVICAYSNSSESGGTASLITTSHNLRTGVASIRALLRRARLNQHNSNERYSRTT